MRRQQKPRGKGGGSRDGGFTLMEVLVALVVLSLLLVSMGAGLEVGLRLEQKARAWTTAALRVQDLAAELGEAALTPNEAGEDEDAGRPGWSWERAVEPVPAVPGLWRVSLTVSWPDRGRRESHTWETLVWRPDWLREEIN